MGMSASQARLLSITSRMNDVQFKSQSISNTKIRLADESEQVANDYTKALNKQKFTYTDYSSGKAVKIDLNSSNLAQYGLRLVARNTTSKQKIASTDRVDVQKTASTDFVGGPRTASINNSTIKPTIPNIGQLGGLTFNKIDDVKLEQNSGVPTKFTASELYEMIESGQFYLERNGVEVSVSSDTQFAIESDSTELAKAEAEYNAKTKKINNKEKLLDNDLKALDTEHSALKTEQDSIKSLIKDNVDKTFNLFS